MREPRGVMRYYRVLSFRWWDEPCPPPAGPCHRPAGGFRTMPIKCRHFISRYSRYGETHGVFSVPLLGDCPSLPIRLPAARLLPAVELRSRSLRASVSFPSLFIKPAHSFISRRPMGSHPDQQNHVSPRISPLLPGTLARVARRDRRRHRSHPRPCVLALRRRFPLISDRGRRSRPPTRILTLPHPSILSPTLRFHQLRLPARWPSHLPVQSARSTSSFSPPARGVVPDPVRLRF